MLYKKSIKVLSRAYAGHTLRNIQKYHLKAIAFKWYFLIAYILKKFAYICFKKYVKIF